MKELYHYGVLGMKWGVRRAAQKATREAYKHKRIATDYTNARLNVKKSIKDGSYKKHGYTSADQAKNDLANYKRITDTHRRIGKNWTATHHEIMRTSMRDVKKSKTLISDAKRYANELMYDLDVSLGVHDRKR